MERATGIEPASSAWEADILPMNYARISILTKLYILFYQKALLTASYYLQNFTLFRDNVRA